MKVAIPFGDSVLYTEIPGRRVKATLVSKFHELKSDLPQAEIVKQALASPIGTAGLAELAKGKKKVLVITADHTRPVPSRITLPPILAALRRGQPDADITILIATGCHRAMTEAEMRERFGDAVYDRERFVVHDGADEGALVKIGTLPSGGECIINRLVVESDLVVSEGFIEPHFFAGYSGGRKAVLPGSASRATVLANHCAEFIASPKARTGILDGNPIHADMIYAAREANMAFILNVVLDGDKKIVAAFAGDTDAAHRAGCDFVGRHVLVKAAPADIVVTSNNGYPLDQNVYQAVKSMTAAEASCRKGGVIICACECRDGHGGQDFADTFKEIPTARGVMDQILSRSRAETEPDQWQIQIFCRVLMHATVIMITGPGAPREMIEKLNMKWAATLDEAMRMAEEIVGKPDAEVTIIPDGIGVIVEE